MCYIISITVIETVEIVVEVREMNLNMTLWDVYGEANKIVEAKSQGHRQITVGDVHETIENIVIQLANTILRTRHEPQILVDPRD